MDEVAVAGRTVRRLGLSVAGLRATGMWGEPARRQAEAVLRRALALGVDIIEVPVPFGPFADLVRDVGAGGAAVVARLTGPVPGPGVLRARLGAPPALVLAEPDLLATVRAWGLPAGVIIGDHHRAPPSPGDRAVRGPYPPPPGIVEGCEAAGIPYMAPDTAVLADGDLTVALPAARSLAEVDDLFGPGTTPRDGGPG